MAINSTTGELYVVRSLDYETERSFSVVVIATDNPGGSEDDKNIAYSVINITVADVNDNAPVFTSLLYQISVAENNETFIVTVTATDQDAGQFIAINNNYVCAHYEQSSFR